MPTINPERLCDHPQALKELLPLMERMFPPANLSDPAKMMDEASRLSLARDAGRREVIEQMQSALAMAEIEARKPRAKPEEYA